jgi:two-component system sensor kinase FixL
MFEMCVRNFRPATRGRYHRIKAMAIDLTDPIPLRKRALILALCALAVAALTVCERMAGPSIPLGPLFLLPLLVAAAFLTRWMIFAAALAVALERELFGPFPWDEKVFVRLSFSMVAFAGAGLFAGELVRNRALLLKHQEEAMRRSDAEREARALVESSPAAVLTINSEGNVAMANEAARRLLGFSEGSPEGEAIDKYIPILGKLLKSKRALKTMGTVVEANGRRLGGETFLSQIWVSLYETSSGPRLAAILSDTTEQLRDREESGLRQLLSSSRIIAGAVSHEIRNLAAAASVLYNNMNSGANHRGGADFEALGRVIESVLKLSSEELQRDDDDEVLEGIEVGEVLEELRMISTPSFEESGARLEWEVGEGLPHVRANHSGLLQVFINLAQNSCRALEGCPQGRLRVSAYQLTGVVVVRFCDNGPGMQSVDRIFQPLQPGASSTGLGLFISRAIIRTFGGELHHTQRPGECTFIIELPAVEVAESADA